MAMNTVWVSKVPSKASREDVAKALSRFGEVREVYLQYRGEDVLASVRFVDPLGFEKALAHSSEGEELTIGESGPLVVSIHPPPKGREKGAPRSGGDDWGRPRKGEKGFGKNRARWDGGDGDWQSGGATSSTRRGDRDGGRPKGKGGKGYDRGGKGDDRGPGRPCNTIFVGGLPSSCTDKELKTEFEQFGEIRHIAVRCKNRNDGKTEAFSFVTFAEISHAQSAIDGLHRSTVFGNPINIFFARNPDDPNKNRPAEKRDRKDGDADGHRDDDKGNDGPSAEGKLRLVPREEDAKKANDEEEEEVVDEKSDAGSAAEGEGGEAKKRRTDVDAKNTSSGTLGGGNPRPKRAANATARLLRVGLPDEGQRGSHGAGAKEVKEPETGRRRDGDRDVPRDAPRQERETGRRRDNDYDRRGPRDDGRARGRFYEDRGDRRGEARRDDRRSRDRRDDRRSRDRRDDRRSRDRRDDRRSRDRRDDRRSRDRREGPPADRDRRGGGRDRVDDGRQPARSGGERESRAKAAEVALAAAEAGTTSVKASGTGRGVDRSRSGGRHRVRDGRDGHDGRNGREDRDRDARAARGTSDRDRGREARDDVSERGAGKGDDAVPKSGRKSSNDGLRESSPSLLPDVPSKAKGGDSKASGGVRKLVRLDNLPQDMSRDELISTCADFGEVVDAKISTKVHDGARSAFVEYRNEKDIGLALKKLDKRRVEGWEKRLSAYIWTG